MRVARSRVLLQGSAPEAVLPDLFKLPTCSIYGSHNTTWMRGAPHVRLGLPAFGPEGLQAGEFHPMASSYLEPLIVLAIPGMLLWMLLGLTLMCFCYRRYHLGRCGEPFPTVKEYTPKQMAANRLLTAATFAALLLLAAQAMLVVSLTMDTAFDAFLEATSEMEDLIRSAAWAKCPPSAVPQPKAVPPQGTPGGPVQLGTRRVRPSHWDPSHGPRCSS